MTGKMLVHFLDIFRFTLCINGFGETTITLDVEVAIAWICLAIVASITFH
jgi:hypothetical protein